MAPPVVRTRQHTCANVSLGTRELHAIKVGSIYLVIGITHSLTHSFTKALARGRRNGTSKNG